MIPNIESAQQLAEKGAHQEALNALENLPSEQQSQPPALYIRAVCMRRLDRRGEALNCLKQILQADPEHVRAYQEIGHVHVAGRNAEKAVYGYTQAVSRDPALLSSWLPLVQLYKMLGDEANSAVAQYHVNELSSLPQELLAAKSFLNQGDLDSADKVCRAFMQQNKQHVEGLRLLAQIAVEAQILDDAEFMLESAVVFEPEHIPAKFDLATVQLKRQKFAAAHKVASQLVELDPNNQEFKTLLSSTKMGVGDTQGAIEGFSDLIDQKINLKAALLLAGHAHKTAGNFDQSVKAYQQLYQHSPDFGDAFWSLANTKTYTFSDAEIAHMHSYEQDPATSLIDRVHFCFALGKAYEDKHDYDQAFGLYERGNQLNNDRTKGTLPDVAKRVQRQIDVCTPELFNKYAGAGCTAADPIFIVGLPRAGSTLLEQILASHSKVDGTHELPDIMSLSRRLRGRAKVKAGEEPRYPALLADIDPELLKTFGESYLNDTRVFRESAPMFIDKMPNNFLHIGLIKLILPNAKIIDARRHPMSCCFSGFKQLFAEGQEFTYGLRRIGEYYREYLRLMDHFERISPGAILKVQHEDVVSDLETQVNRILDYCGLEFEQSCVEFYKTKRNVRTPSAEQVRQPIYTTGLDHWRNFENHLAPLKDALGPEILARYPIQIIGPLSEMIFSEQHKFVYFAVPKTATHSVRSALRPSLGVRDWEQQALFGQSWSPIAQLAAVGHGHIGVRLLKATIAPEVWQGSFKFAFVRNPFDRFVSVCAFLNRQNPEFTQRPRQWMKLAIQRPEFRKRVLVRPQVDQLLDDDGQCPLDFIGRYENLEADLAWVLDKLSLPEHTLLHTNQSEHAHYRELYDDELSECVATFYAKDLSFFDYDFDQ